MDDYLDVLTGNLPESHPVRTTCGRGDLVRDRHGRRHAGGRPARRPSTWLQRLGGLYVEIVPQHPAARPAVHRLRRAAPGGRAVSPWVAGTASLGLYTGAYVAEALRSGVFAVSRGQIEASLSLGFTYAQTLRRIVLPQAFRTVIPPLGILMIAMIKNSAIIGVSLLALPDLLKEARIVQSRTFETDEAFFWAAVGYLLLTVTVTVALPGARVEATRSADELPLRPRQLGVAGHRQQPPLHPRGLPGEPRDRGHRDGLLADLRVAPGARAAARGAARGAWSPGAGSTCGATCR